MLLEHLTLQGSNSSQETGWVARPNLPFLHLDVVGDHCSRSHHTSRLDGGVTDSRAHRDESPVLEGSSLEDGVRAHEDIVADGGVAGHVDAVLQNGVVSHADRGAAQQSSAVPNGRISAHNYIAEDGGVRGDEGGLLEGGLLSLIGQSAQAGRDAVFAEGLSLQLVADFVEALAGGAEGWAQDLLVETIEDLVDHHSHQIIITLSTPSPHVNALAKE